MFEVVFVYIDKNNPSLCNSWEDEYDEMKDIIEDLNAFGKNFEDDYFVWINEIDDKKHTMTEMIYNVESTITSIYVKVTKVN